jgi:hypothetical protein
MPALSSRAPGRYPLRQRGQGGDDFWSGRGDIDRRYTNDATGRSNAGFAAQLFLGERTVEAVTAQVFRELDLEPSPDVNQRVLALLTLLRG